MTIEAIELAIRRVLAAGHLKQGRRVPEFEILEALADELAYLRRCGRSAHPEHVPEPGYKLKWK